MVIVEIIVIIMIEICKNLKICTVLKQADFELWTYLQNSNFVLGKART